MNTEIGNDYQLSKRNVASVLLALSGSDVTYNADRNMYLTKEYVGGAGVYYQAIRVSERLVMCFNLGESCTRTFMNGIKIFAWNGIEAVLIASKSWGGCGNWMIFCEQNARTECEKMLKDYLAAEAKKMNCSMSESQLRDSACMLYAKTLSQLPA